MQTNDQIHWQPHSVGNRSIHANSFVKEKFKHTHIWQIISCANYYNTKTNTDKI